jgi:predicted nuclease of restriction endonuclease-like (RecB) superfamily
MGAKVVHQLALDLKREFPDMKGLSRSNLLYMRAFAQAWPHEEFVQAVLGQLSWYHQIALIEKLKSPAEREWYVRAAIDNGWSRNVLVLQIENRTHERQGAAITNFHHTLPAPQSDLAQQLFKDPYILDFMTLAEDAAERDLETSLIDHLKDFLLELGKGFAFIGRQYRLEVGGQDFYLDLLFYNTRLHCHVAIELKTDDFKPEYAGKMQFYLAAIDAQLKSERDDPTIGLILCRTKNGVIVEYTLRDATRPIGVAEYRSLPPALAKELPSVEELERELGRAALSGSEMGCEKQSGLPRKHGRPPATATELEDQPSCFSSVCASDTSNLPGPSMLSCSTTPSFTSIE